MELPQQEVRTCDVCGNTLVLNLFPLNSSTCRYCLAGSEVPRRLKNSGQSSSDHLVVEKQANDSKENNELKDENILEDSIQEDETASKESKLNSIQDYDAWGGYQ